MKHKISNILISSILTLSIGLGFSFALAKNNQTPTAFVEAETVESYYSSITDSMSGTTLLNALNSLNNTKRKKMVGYNTMRTFAAKCDADPDGSGKIIGFYDNAKIGPDWDGGSTWNREHVWPNIRGGSAVEDDAHMTRPAATATNSDRGSKGFGKNSYDPGKTVAYYRGVASRIIFYAAIADTSLQLADEPFNYNGVQNGNNGYPVETMGCLADMLEWNLQYKPNDTSFTGANDLARRTEINRNTIIQTNSSGQGNRNPFIDHPEYACRIWGNYSDKTRKACGIDQPTGTTVTLNKSSLEVTKGNTVSLTATSSQSDKLTWTVDNDNISLSKTSSNSGDAVTITGNKVGTSKITIRNTYDGVATCNVTVNPKTGTEVYLTYDEYTLKVGEDFSMCAVSTENDEITWSTDNDNILLSTTKSDSYVDIAIGAMHVGETIITARNTCDGVATCRVIVTDDSGSTSSEESSESSGGNTTSTSTTSQETENSEQNGGKSSSILGCGGVISASSAAIFVVSMIGAIYFIRRRKDE